MDGRLHLGGPGAGPALGRGAHDVLRLAVAAFRQYDPRGSHPPVVHVGQPGGLDADFVDLPRWRLDHALRTEVLAALLSRAQVGMARPLAWLTRSGSLVAEDADLAWYAAARAAYGEAEVPLAMVVVTGGGWYDPRTGARREWKRLRLR